MNLQSWRKMDLIGQNTYGAFVSEVCIEHLEKRIVNAIKAVKKEFGYNILLDDDNTLCWADGFMPIVTIRRIGLHIKIRCSSDANQFGLPLIIAAQALIPRGGANPYVIIDGVRLV